MPTIPFALLLASFLGGDTPRHDGAGHPAAVRVVRIRATYDQTCTPIFKDATGGYPKQDAPCQRKSQNPDYQTCMALCYVGHSLAYCDTMCTAAYLTPCGLQPNDEEEDCLVFEPLTLSIVESGICEGRPCKIHIAGTVTFKERCGAGCNPKCCSSGSGVGLVNGLWINKTFDPKSPSFEWNYDITAPCPSAADQQITLEVLCNNGTADFPQMANLLRFWTCKGCGVQ